MNSPQIQHRECDTTGPVKFLSINPKAAYSTIDNFLHWGLRIKIDGLKQKKK